MFANKIGLPSILKSGNRVFDGVDETTLKSIAACVNIATIIKTSYGPKGLRKVIVDGHAKRLLTSKALKILNGLEIQHPCVRMLLEACELHSKEYGNCTGFLFLLACEILANAANLISEGLSPVEICSGLQVALDEIEERHEKSIIYTLTTPYTEDSMRKVTRSLFSIQSIDDAVFNCFIEATVNMLSDGLPNFSPENLKVTKLSGTNMECAKLIQGVVVSRFPNGTVQTVGRSRMAVYGTALDMTGTETKGTVLFQSAEELLHFSSSEEALAEKLICNIVDLGVGVIAVQGSISDLFQHYCNLNNILVLKIMSKFELRRIAKSVGAAIMVRLGVPTREELGEVERVNVVDLGERKITVVESPNTRAYTIVLRMINDRIMDEIEEKIIDAAQMIKKSLVSPSFVAGGGGWEMSMATSLRSMVQKISTTEIHGVLAVAESFENIVELIHQDSVDRKNEKKSQLRACYTKDPTNPHCINITKKEATVGNPINCGILDHSDSKLSAIRFAIQVSSTILKIDSIIMSKPAGGPKPRDPQAPDLD